MKKFYDVFTRKEYQQNGEKKYKWYRAGILKESVEEGIMYLTLFHQPSTDFFAFEKEKSLGNDTSE